MGGWLPRANGEFYCDRGTWEWRWNGSLWTWYPFYVPLDDDVFHYGGAWVSEYGEVWRGVDPNVWARACGARMRRNQWQRRRQDFVRCQLVRSGLQQLMPEELADTVLAFGIGRTAQRSTDAIAGGAADVAAEALKTFQDLIDKMVL